MTREEARQQIRNDWRHIMPAITEPAKRNVNGEASWVCPLCGHGKGGDGMTANPQSKDGNGLKCFSCGFSGDIIDLYQQTTGRDHSAALEELAQIAGVRLDSSYPRQTAAQDFAGLGGLTAGNGPQCDSKGRGSTETPQNGETPQRACKRATEGAADFTAYYEECSARVEDPAAVSYLNGRGVLGPAIFLGVGFDPQADPANAPGAMGEDHRPHPCPRIIIPCSKGHYVARSIDPDTPPQYAKLNPSRAKGASAPAIFNEAALYAQDVQEVFITEGAFDALSVVEAGGQAVALNSASNARALVDMIEKHPTAATLILCLDNDKAGSKAAQEVQEGLQRIRQPFIVADITRQYKDPNDALVSDRPGFLEAVQDAVAEARAYKEKLRQEALQEQKERQQRTGAGMIDSFLDTVRSRKYEPIPTGITDIDKAIGGGFIRQQLVLLGAAPGAGKTALAQWIFEGMAKRGVSCLYLNLEMSRDQMLARSLSRIAKANGDTIKATEILQGYKWDAAQEIIVKSAAEVYRKEIAPRMIYNPDGVEADLDSILEYAELEAQQAEAAGQPAPVVVLDYLQIVKGKDREDDTAVIKRAVSSLKKYAIQHDTVVFLIIAHNRAANQSGIVTQESGRDTSALEYSADLQLGLAFTKCLKRPGQDKKSKEDLTPEEMQFVTLKVTKGRFARPGVEVDLHFNGETMTYTQLVSDFRKDEARQPDKRNTVRI